MLLSLLPTLMKTVLTQEASISSSISETRLVCRVCQKQFAKYTCPRCNSRYCSLPCYKGHSLRCTESFMHENVMDEMRQIQPEDETKRKMLDILKRFHSEEEMECEEEDDSTLSEETIQTFLSGNNIRFEDLSNEEMKQFQRAVASGMLSKMIKPWEPWWLKPSARTVSLSQSGTQLVREIDEHDLQSSSQNTSENSFSQIPAGPEAPLLSINRLSQIDPSPLLAVHLLDVLYTYCFTLRLYNGDWHCDSLGASMVVLTISSVLKEGALPETAAEALSNCLEQACSPMYRHIGSFQFGLGLLDDVIKLLSLNSNTLICLLCDLRRLILAGRKMLKSEKTCKAEKEENRRKLKFSERKIYFFMCWVHNQPTETWSCMESMVRAEKDSLASVEYDHRQSNMETESGNKNGVLIKEVKASIKQPCRFLSREAVRWDG